MLKAIKTAFAICLTVCVLLACAYGGRLAALGMRDSIELAVSEVQSVLRSAYESVIALIEESLGISV